MINMQMLTEDEIRDIITVKVQNQCQKCKSTKANVIIKSSDEYEFDLETKELTAFFLYENQKKEISVVCQECNAHLFP